MYCGDGRFYTDLPLGSEVFPFSMVKQDMP